MAKIEIDRGDEIRLSGLLKFLERERERNNFLIKNRHATQNRNVNDRIDLRRDFISGIEVVKSLIAQFKLTQLDLFTEFSEERKEFSEKNVNLKDNSKLNF